MRNNKCMETQPRRDILQFSMSSFVAIRTMGFLDWNGEKTTRQWQYIMNVEISSLHPLFCINTLWPEDGHNDIVWFFVRRTRCDRHRRRVSRIRFSQIKISMYRSIKISPLKTPPFTDTLLQDHISIARQLLSAVGGGCYTYICLRISHSIQFFLDDYSLTKLLGI